MLSVRPPPTIEIGEEAAAFLVERRRPVRVERIAEEHCFELGGEFQAPAFVAEHSCYGFDARRIWFHSLRQLRPNRSYCEDECASSRENGSPPPVTLMTFARCANPSGRDS